VTGSSGTHSLAAPAAPGPAERSHIRVLFVPDSIHWITGTLARSFVAHNPWLEGSIISGPVLDIVGRQYPDLFDSFDLVHFVCPYASRNWLPKLSDGLPAVTSHHHVSDAWELQRHNLEGDAIIVGSQQWADDVIQRGASPDRVVCVPYGVDASKFVPATAQERLRVRQELEIAPDATVVGFFAKQSSNEQDRKGTDVLVAGITELSNHPGQVAVLIIGPGWDDLISQLTATGARVVWLPFVEDAARMRDMYKALDFYWVTARIEGGPVTLLEAMSSGVCCITTSVGLAREIVEDRVNGVIVPFDDPHAFARETSHLTQRKLERESIGVRARETILGVMDVPITSQGIRRVYDVAEAHFSMRGTSDARRALVRRRSSRIPSELLKRIGILEQLVWAEALMLQGQKRLAFSMMRATWLKHPFSTLPPRFLFRNLLPHRLVRTLVRVKASLVGKP
jgi:glycosyltransferase involved in cell wall biosynthesis